MKSEFRSSCPIASALDIIGDKWSLLLVRDMLTIKKKTFKEFSDSSEGIAPGILSSRLKWLEENGLLSKRKLPDNQKENIYLLTEKGIELAPVILELILWSYKNLKSQNPEMPSIEELGLDRENPKLTEVIQNNYRNFIIETLG
jgi:DNA-binding HxlR family transcriptional regulator